MKFNSINKILLSTFVASANAYELLKDYAGDLKIGVAAASMRFSNSNYVNAMKAFNMMVAENDCKLSGIQQQKGVYNFNGCDNHYKKAKELGMEFRGHCLIWHAHQPSWFQNADANTLKNAIVDHITKTLQHYEGKIKVWDVVNEAIDDGSNGNGFSMRRSFLYNKVPNFVDIAFQTARKVSPNTKLFYNDYNAEGQYPKSESIYNFVADLKKRNIPIDGIGLQYHVGARSQPSYDKINNLIGRYCKLGLEVHITELDVKLEGNQNGQTQAFTNALKACLANSCCKAFLVWGVGDNDSWLGANEQALLFNGNYQPKPVYTSLLNVLKSSARPASNNTSNNASNNNSSGNPPKTGKTKTVPKVRTKTIPASLLRTKTIPAELISSTKTIPGNLVKKTKTIPKDTSIPKTKVLPSSIKRTKTVPQSLLSKTKTIPESLLTKNTGKTKTLPARTKTLPQTQNSNGSKVLPAGSKTKTLPNKTKTIPANLVSKTKTLPNITKKTKTIPANLVSKTKTLPNLSGEAKTIPNGLGSKTKTLPNLTSKTKTIPKGLGSKTKTLPNLTSKTKTIPKDLGNKTKTLPNGGGNGGNNGNCVPTTVTVTVTVTVNSEPTNDSNCVAKWGQCGGINYQGPKCCQSGSTCIQFNEWYHQCV